MGIWLKKFKYGKFLKALASIILCALVIVLAEVAIFEDASNQDFALEYQLEKSSYYDTLIFKERYISKAGYARDWIVRYSESLIYNPDFITAEEIEAYKQTAKGQEILKFSEQGMISNDKDFLEDKIKTEIVYDRKRYFEEIEEQLFFRAGSFVFIAIDNETKKVVTNIQTYNKNNLEDIVLEMSKSPVYLVGDAKGYTYKGQYEMHRNYYNSDTISDHEAKRYTIHAAIDETRIQQGNEYDLFSAEKQTFEMIKEAGNILKVILLVMMLLGFFAGLYLVFTAGKRYDETKIYFHGLDKVPADIQVVALLMIEYFLMNIAVNQKEAAISIRGIKNIISQAYYDIISVDTIDTVFLYIIITLGTIMAILVGMSIIKKIKAHTLLKNSLVYYLCNLLLKALFHEKTLSIGVAVGATSYIIINMLLSVVFVWQRSFIIFFLLINFNILALVAIIVFAVDYRKIVIGAQHIANGDLGYKIAQTSIFPITAEMANTVNSIGEGLERAASTTLKSERFKTELITNVSHDLKTPLTSIISYIELLQQEAIENEEAKQYINILAERSERLKRLIEDLIEASKATTGNLSLEMGAMQLDELVKQIIGEHSDKFEEQGLDIIYSRMQTTSILADGKHMWRVVENLATNIIKYAMLGTRVYIDVFEEDGYGTLTMKNVSKEPLNIDVSELTKRFVRGEESRTKEGFGLGLAIAESLVQLQKGKFEIAIDGDLFKVCIKMPIIHNDEELKLNKTNSIK